MSNIYNKNWSACQDKKKNRFLNITQEYFSLQMLFLLNRETKDKIDTLFAKRFSFFLFLKRANWNSSCMNEKILTAIFAL